MRGIVLLGLVACGATASLRTSPTLLLADAGSEPRFTLRYAIPDGSSHALVHVVRVNRATVPYRGTLTRHGDTVEMRGQGGVRVTAPLDARGYLDARFVLPRLPEEPVGAGASWSYDAVGADLLPVTHHHVATVTEVSSTVARWHEVDTVSEPQRHYVVRGRDWNVALSGRGDTYVWIDLSAFTVDVESHFTLTILGTVDAQRRHLTLETIEHLTLE